MAKEKDQLLSKLRQEVAAVSVQELHKQIEAAGGTIAVLDVREPGEYEQGYIPGAKYIPRTYLELRVEDELPDKNQPVYAYCAGGTRSLFAADVLKKLGYQHVYSVDGGFNAWKNAGYGFAQNKLQGRVRSARYSRHLLVPEVGEAGQQKLLESRVLMVGAGGLGSPVAIYLAAAGVGKLGIIDPDMVDESNLQRQVIHRTIDVGRPKVDSARDFIKNLNPDVDVVQYKTYLDSSNIFGILDDGWDVIINGCDNFPTRYLINDAAYMRKIPVVDGSIFRFDGQVTVYQPDEGPCYRCLYPEPPPPELAPSCAEAGVLGVLTGVIGTIQATETIKVLLKIGKPLVGQLLLYDALGGRFRNLKAQKDPACPLCGEHPTIHELIDYAWFCSAERIAGVATDTAAI